jgi:hypothetical protein
VFLSFAKLQRDLLSDEVEANASGFDVEGKSGFDVDKPGFDVEGKAINSMNGLQRLVEFFFFRSTFFQLELKVSF